MADFDGIAKQFVTFYYNTFDNDRPSLSSLYRDHSMLTYEEQQFVGTAKIMEKLTILPFQKARHEVVTVAPQPSSADGAILVQVSGLLYVDAEPKPMSFAQTFQLVPEGGSYFVFNDMFQLVFSDAKPLRVKEEEKRLAGTVGM